MMIVISGIAVALVAFIIYALDRKSKGESLAWDTAGKLSLLSGLITSGVVFATTADVPIVHEVIKTVTDSIEDEMFVGKPTF